MVVCGRPAGSNIRVISTYHSEKEATLPLQFQEVHFQENYIILFVTANLGMPGYMAIVMSSSISTTTFLGKLNFCQATSCSTNFPQTSGWSEGQPSKRPPPGKGCLIGFLLRYGGFYQIGVPLRSLSMGSCWGVYMRALEKYPYGY